MPRSYIPKEVKERVKQAANNRCGYCLSPQHLLMARLEIEHIIPLAKGGSNDEQNLWLACPICNRYKGDKIVAADPESREEIMLFNPRTENWFEHFRWSDDGLLILGKTATGRATVGALQLSSDPDVLTVRSYWVLAGWHPPEK